MSKNLLVVITGPTGSGKTGLSINLAKVLGCSIISADSRQVFKELPIGSAAPTEDEMNGIPHYFIGDRSISEEFNAGIFEKEALSLLEQLFKVNPVQIVCGGTGLYIKALLHGMDDLPKSSPEYRIKLTEQWEANPESLKTKLKQLDPIYYAEADLSNKQRVIRALEVINASGETYSSLRTKQQKTRDFDTWVLGIDTPRKILYERINARTLLMLKEGWLEEVKKIVPYQDINALRTVGYQELIEHLKGKMSLGDAIALIQQNTRRYAKRQVTWLRHQEKVDWINLDIEIEELILKIDQRLA
jgi:tRNA dimethylallyltransferase